MTEPTPSAGAPEYATSKTNTPATSADPSRTGTPVEKPPDESGKLKTLISVLRKFIGVADLAAVRFSLPAQLMEPVPNLEYWQYLDAPETFVSIGDSEDPLGRMLGALRFWFSKDLKYIKGKPCKPYNSTLGEFFRCNWEAEDNQPAIKYSESAPEGPAPSGKKLKVSFLCEQTSHHPPVSAYWYDCPEKGIVARGYDQLSAKFTGTSIRVVPGNHNEGIFIELQKHGETYQLTHPAAYLGGILRGSLGVSVADTCFVSCAKTKLKVILEYKAEGWLGRAQNQVEGAIFPYNPESDTITRLKDVPDKEVLARIDGSWQEKVFYSLGPAPFAKAKNKYLLLDLNPLFPAPKLLPPESDQLPNESRIYWKNVTDAILSKQFSLATTHKQEIEDRQRAKAAERKETNAEWHPRFFTGAVAPAGKPELSKDGEEVLRGLHENTFKLEPNKVYGA